MRLGIPTLSLTSAPTVPGVVQSAGEIVARSMRSWYDAKDAGQEVPNRNDPGADPMLLGLTPAVEAEDPTILTTPRRLWRIGTAGQRLRLPASDIPTNGEIAAGWTIVVVGAVPATNTATGALWDGGGTVYRGFSMLLSGGNILQATIRSATQTATDTQGAGLNDGVLRTFAGVADAGDLTAYNSRDGLGASPVSYAAITAPDFGQPTIGARSDGNNGSTTLVDVAAVLVADFALTETQLADLADFIEGGAYT